MQECKFPITQWDEEGIIAQVLGNINEGTSIGTEMVKDKRCNSSKMTRPDQLTHFEWMSNAGHLKTLTEPKLFKKDEPENMRFRVGPERRQLGI